MNRKEASFILANIDRRVCDDELNEALDMAIKALEQEPVFFPPCQDCNTKMNEIRRAYDKLQEPCGNAIDRAEAIKVASGYCHPANVARELAKLPSVNPTKTGWIPVSERLPDKHD